MKKNVFAGLLCLAVGMTATAQKLDKFGADLAKKSVMGKEIRVPYTDIQSYFGFIKPFFVCEIMVISFSNNILF